MKDYSGIHERIVDDAYQYTEGWKQTFGGIWFCVGLILGLVIGVIV